LQRVESIFFRLKSVHLVGFDPWITSFDKFE
jgi:hypothetical protein